VRVAVARCVVVLVLGLAAVVLGLAVVVCVLGAGTVVGLAVAWVVEVAGVSVTLEADGGDASAVCAAQPLTSNAPATARAPTARERCMRDAMPNG
jgi:hypothetical protein